jgi:20S proteasome alpha/beta subunit
MTLVIAATATDGVVLASDTRSTDRKDLTYVDGKVKSLRLGTKYMLGFAGAGESAEALVREHQQALGDATSTRRASDALKDAIVRANGFPDASFLLAGCQPTPELCFVRCSDVCGKVCWSVTPVSDHFFVMGFARQGAIARLAQELPARGSMAQTADAIRKTFGFMSAWSLSISPSYRLWLLGRDGSFTGIMSTLARKETADDQT